MTLGDTATIRYWKFPGGFYQRVTDEDIKTLKVRGPNYSSPSFNLVVADTLDPCIAMTSAPMILTM